MTVVAMSHELGSLGGEIARDLARRMDLDCVDEVLLQERIADRLASISDTLYGADDRGGFRALQQCRAKSDRLLMRHAMEAMTEMAAYGNVIIRGWGSAYLLRNSPFVLRIRLLAPMDFRLNVLARRNPSWTQCDLRRFILTSDSCLGSNLEPIIGSRWRADELYHLNIDSSIRTKSEIVACIQTFAAKWRHENAKSSAGVGTNFVNS